MTEAELQHGIYNSAGEQNKSTKIILLEDAYTCWLSQKDMHRVKLVSRGYEWCEVTSQTIVENMSKVLTFVQQAHCVENEYKWWEIMCNNTIHHTMDELIMLYVDYAIFSIQSPKQLTTHND